MTHPVYMDDAQQRIAFGQRLREAREALKLTGKDVEAQIGVKYKTIYAWEKGNGMLGALTLKALCRVYQVSPEQLLWGDEPDAPTRTGLGDFRARMSRYGAELALAFDERAAKMPEAGARRLFLWLRREAEVGWPARPMLDGSAPGAAATPELAPTQKTPPDKSRVEP